MYRFYVRDASISPEVVLPLVDVGIHTALQIESVMFNDF